MWPAVIFICQGLSLLGLFCKSLVGIIISLPVILLRSLVPGWRQRSEGCAFYEGTVHHDRRKPVKHDFSYPLRLALIDLDCFPSWFTDQAKDHWSAEEVRLKARTSGKVKLLTNPMSCGYIQNPISVYFCFSETGSLEKCIAEVTNTPWGARVLFLFDPSGQTVQKSLHVSPFMDMKSTWHLFANLSDEKISVTISVEHPDMGSFFDASMYLKKSSTDDRYGLKTQLRYLFMPHRVAFWIYLNAWKLLRKGAKFYPYPEAETVRSIENNCQACPLKFSDGNKFVWQDSDSFPWK